MFRSIGRAVVLYRDAGDIEQTSDAGDGFKYYIWNEADAHQQWASATAPVTGQLVASAALGSSIAFTAR